MLKLEEIREAVERIALQTFGADDLDHVEVEPAIDSQGEDALRVVIVLADGVPDRVSGDQILDALVAIQNDLETAGEARLPIVEYATPGEIELDRQPDIRPGY